MTQQIQLLPIMAEELDRLLAAAKLDYSFLRSFKNNPNCYYYGLWAQPSDPIWLSGFSYRFEKHLSTAEIHNLISDGIAWSESLFGTNFFDSLFSCSRAHSRNKAINKKLLLWFQVFAEIARSEKPPVGLDKTSIAAFESALRVEKEEFLLTDINSEEAYESFSWSSTAEGFDFWFSSFNSVSGQTMLSLYQTSLGGNSLPTDPDVGVLVAINRLKAEPPVTAEEMLGHFASSD
jgi:hypothetical protein